MDGPIISCDISKGSGHIQGFIAIEKPISKSIKIKYDVDGFNILANLKKDLEKQTGITPNFVFEFTGTYQIPIVHKVLALGMKLYGISPLESAKVRKSFIRTTKTDSRDAKNIASVYYSRTLREFKIVESNLLINCRYRDTLIKKRSNMKNTVAKYLDVVFPLFLDYFSSCYSDCAVYAIRHYRCINAIKRRSIEEIARTIENKTCHRRDRSINFAAKLKEYASRIESCINEDSAYCDALVNALENVVSLEAQIKEFDALILNEATKHLLFKIYSSIPGVSGILAANFIAEFGDLSQFKCQKQLVAFCGLDPSIMQSGNISGEHLQITKKGNKRMRRILYLIVSCMIRNGNDNQITRFYFKRKSSGLPHKSAAIASCRKLLCCIYGMISNKTSFEVK